MKTGGKFSKNQNNLSVLSRGSLISGWYENSKKPIISKIIQRDAGDYAIVLTEDVSKPIRFLYLTLLTDKNRFSHLRAIIMRIKKLIMQKVEIVFQDLSLQMREIGESLEELEVNLKQLQKKMQEFKDDEVVITQFCEQYAVVDPLLILSLRAIASCPEYNIKNSLNCSQAMSFSSIHEILRKFEIKRDERNELNKYIIFVQLKQIDLKYFSEQAHIEIERQQQNCQELFDAYLLKYEEQIVLEQMYSLLEEN